MEAAAGEFNDWEFLLNTDAALNLPSDLIPISGDLEGIDGDSKRVIKSDYFALDSDNRSARGVDDRVEGFVHPDKPGSVGSGLDRDGERVSIGDFEEIQLPGRNSSEFWSDLAGDGSEAVRLGYNDKEQVGLEGSQLDAKSSGEFLPDSDGNDEIRVLKEKSKLDLGDYAITEANPGGIEIDQKDSAEYRSDSGGNGSVSPKYGVAGETSQEVAEFSSTVDTLELFGGAESGNVSADVIHTKEDAPPMDGNITVDAEKECPVEEPRSSEGEAKRIIWWKLPFELLKFCSFRVSPVWSFSIAAAVVGFVLLRRRLYKMKRKTRSIPLNLSMDDKKASQFLIRVARLNEAFSVVRRVPAVTPSLPGAGGLTPWPVMSLR